MTATAVCWLIFAALLAAVCVTAGNGLALALLVTLLALPPLHALVNLIARKGLRLELVCPVNQSKGQTGTVELRLENTSRLPLIALSCRVELCNMLTGCESTVLCRASLPPRSRRTLPLDLSSSLCGRVGVKALRLRLYDCFGLLPVACAQTAAGAVTVQPDTFPVTVTVSADAVSPDDCENYSPYKPGRDMSETFQLREYREGDSLRQMHWKLTQKLDRPIVRDPSLPVTRSVLLLWERASAAAEAPLDADAQAEALVSLAKALLGMSVSFDIAWNERESDRCVILEIRDMDDLIGALPRLLSAAALPQGDSVGELLRRTAARTNYAHVVCLTRDPASAAALPRDMGRVTVLLCGGEAAADRGGETVVFDRSAFAQQLRALVI